MNAVRVSEVGLGETVAVIGLGLVGQLIAQLARLQGAAVIAIDLKADRVNLARELGADQALTPESSIDESISALTNGHGVDCVFIAAAAKSAAPCEQALRICRDRGRIVVVGAVELQFPWHEMYLKEIQLLMSRAYGPGSYDESYEKQGRDYPFSYVRWTENRNMEEFLRLVSLGRVQLEPLITHRFALEEAAAAYQTIMDPASGSLAVLLRYPYSESPASLNLFEPKRRVDLSAPPHAAGDLGVALIGAGNLARWAHLPNLKKLPNVTLRAICSNNGARAKSYAQRFGAAYCASDYNELLNDSQTDLVVILTRNQHHATQALSALQAGKHVFVEKPMALTVEDCRLLEQAVAESGKQLTVGFNRRFAPFYSEMKQALIKRTGPTVLSCRMNSPGISGSYWMADPAIGGAILGEACHFIDLMYWLLDSEPVSVSAYCLPTDKVDPIGQNNMVASFRFADGSVGNLTYCTVGSKTSSGERVEAFAQGVGAMSENFTRLEVNTGQSQKRKRLFAEKGYAAQMESFVKSIREGSLPGVTVRDGSRATIGCLLMLESALDGMPRKIDLTTLLD